MFCKWCSRVLQKRIMIDRFYVPQVSACLADTYHFSKNPVRMYPALLKISCTLISWVAFLMGPRYAPASLRFTGTFKTACSCYQLQAFTKHPSVKQLMPGLTLRNCSFGYDVCNSACVASRSSSGFATSTTFRPWSASRVANALPMPAHNGTWTAGRQ